MTTRSIGIIGVGEIASAVVDGLCWQPGAAPDVFLSPRNEAVAAQLAARHRTVHVCPDNQGVVDSAQVVLLAVRPEVIGDVLDDIRVPEDRIVISAVAGLSHDALRRVLGEDLTIVRAIPLPSVRRRHGITAIHPAHPEVEQLFDSLGGTLVVDDADTLTAIQTATATISTYLEYLATVASWLEEHGIAQADAEGYVRGMFHGVSDGLGDRTRTLSQLAVAHETPRGLNEQLRQGWFTEGNRAALRRGLSDVYSRLTK